MLYSFHLPNDRAQPRRGAASAGAICWASLLVVCVLLLIWIRLRRAFLEKNFQLISYRVLLSGLLYVCEDFARHRR